MNKIHKIPSKGMIKVLSISNDYKTIKILRKVDPNKYNTILLNAEYEIYDGILYISGTRLLFTDIENVFRRLDLWSNRNVYTQTWDKSWKKVQEQLDLLEDPPKIQHVYVNYFGGLIKRKIKGFELDQYDQYDKYFKQKKRNPNITCTNKFYNYKTIISYNFYFTKT